MPAILDDRETRRRAGHRIGERPHRRPGAEWVLVAAQHRRGSGDERQLIAEVRPAGGHALTPTHALRRLLANPAGEQRPALIGLLEA